MTSAFVTSNKRENIHLGVIQSQWDYDTLPVRFTRLIQRNLAGVTSKTKLYFSGCCKPSRTNAP